MASHLIRGAVVTPETIVADGAVLIIDEELAFVGATADLPVDLHHGTIEHSAPAGGWILPGLVDIHCHGGGGASFPDVPDAESARIAVGEHRTHGTTSLVASLVTQTPQALSAAVRVLTDLVESGDLVGIHVEGPFVSVARCGAQDPALIQTPDPQLVRDLAALAHGALVTMTLAPELQGNLGVDGVARTLIEHGAIPSFGHTDAAHGEMRAGLAEAFEALRAPGTRSPRPTVTHLFNGMRPVHHRERGPILDALSAARRGQAVIELVADGVHLEPAIVKEIFEIAGAANIALVTDAMAAAGMVDGTYQLGSLAVVVNDHVARVVDGSATGGSLAGGTAHLLDVVRTTVAAGVPLFDAVLSASLVPAQVLGRSDIGALVPGARADIVVVDQDLRPAAVWRRGTTSNPLSGI